MARSATSTTPKGYAVEIFGPAVSGTYDGRVCCDGRTIGWTGQYGRHQGVKQEAVAICERHAAGTTVVEIDLAAARRQAAEAQADLERRRRPPEVPALTAEEVAEMNRQTAERSGQNFERNEEKKAKGYARIFKEKARLGRSKPRVPA